MTLREWDKMPDKKRLAKLREVSGGAVPQDILTNQEAIIALVRRQLSRRSQEWGDRMKLNLVNCGMSFDKVLTDLRAKDICKAYALTEDPK